MSTNSHLALWLDGPLMAWGHDSYFNHRHTALWPTKSGIIGLLAAARGFDKLVDSHKEAVKSLAGTRMTAIRFPRQIRGEPLPLGLLNDYHTVGAYDLKRNPDDRLRVPAKAGSRAPRQNPDVTHRHYLEDARFGVVLSGLADVLEPCVEALSRPHWGIWFGRKSCLPAAPVLPTGAKLRTEFNDAWRDLLTAAGLDEQPIESFDRCVELDADADAPDLQSPSGLAAHSDSWNDQPICFGPQNHDRAFIRRRIVEFRVAKASTST